MRVSPQVRVDLVPDVIVKLVAALLGPARFPHPFPVRRVVPHGSLLRQDEAALLRVLLLQALFQGDGIHAHQHLEDFEVALQVVGGGQQAAQHARLGQDQRLAAFPIAAQSSECLANMRHLLFVRLGRELLHRQQLLDQRGGVTQGVGDDGGVGHGVTASKGSQRGVQSLAVRQRSNAGVRYSVAVGVVAGQIKTADTLHRSIMERIALAGWRSPPSPVPSLPGQQA